jgi:hypothetical protein
MPLYSAHFLSHTDETLGVQHYQAADDDTAIRYASDVLRSPWGKGHEIWQGDRLVHREVYK